MKKFTEHEYMLMVETLTEIEFTSDNNLQRAERSYKVIQTAMQRVKEYILQYEFKDKEEEIIFFKEIKPMFLSELIYFMKVFYIEADKPLGDKELMTAYYKQAIERINVFLERNHLLYIYYRMGKSDHDTRYFVRTGDRDELLPEYNLDIDTKFSTIYSYKFAKMQAYERLNDYLQQAIFILDHPDTRSEAGEKKSHRSLWTESKAALIELAYALYSRGAVNHGKGNIKHLIADLGMVFNIDVGNFYRTFQSMRIRKKSRTPFLDTLKESLEDRMDDTDLHFS